jgi:uncharacterized short protein YbdD (DUF466 family)
MKLAPTAPLARLWGALRSLSGDDAYERYLAHHRREHPGEEPLDRRGFYVQEQERRFSSGPTRCC